MLKLRHLLGFLKTHSKQNHGSKLQRRFIMRVLVPPFFILLLLGLVIFWQLNKFVRQQAITELKRASSTTAIKLEREFAIRQTVLRRTGEELFVIKSSYQSSKQSLEENRSSCSAYIKQKRTFQGAPSGSCDLFLPEFAVRGVASLQAVEDGYVRNGNELIKTQNQSINDRLAAYKQFFPETMMLLVLDDKGQVVSSAQSEAISSSSTEAVTKIAAAAPKDAVEGQLIELSGLRLAVFAYPIENGSVLAAYDLGNDNFVRDTWKSTPIDTREALALIVDAKGQPSYPVLPFSSSVTDADASLRKQAYADLSLKNIPHIAVGSEVGKTKWMVVVASPAAAVLAPLHDAQLIAVVIIGSLLVGFLWVGAFFIQRTLRSILGLVSGALVFASGDLDYKIKLKKADAEFTSLADTLNTMAERIAAAEKEIDEKNKEFISVATHELRTPLTAIIGNLSMVYEDYGDRLDATVKPLVEQVYSSTNRLRDLVNDMLDVARMEGGRAEFNIVQVDPTAVVGGVVDTLQVTAKDSGIGLSYNSTEAQKVMADEARLRIVLNNFVSNAIKYNRSNGKVTIFHSVKGNKLVTAIADTGLGIPEDQKAHMFEKFFRVQHDDRKNVVGTGLGMYITRQYILAMGGDLWFESVHGQGTTFFFSLPLVAQITSQPATDPPSLPANGGPGRVISAPLQKN